MRAHTQLSDTSDLDALQKDDDLQVRTAQLARKVCVYVHTYICFYTKCIASSGGKFIILS